MKRKSDYKVVAVTEDSVFIRDLNLGGLSVTNDAENVVEQLLKTHGIKDIVYQDTEGQWDMLIHDGTQFIGFGAFRGDLPDNF